MRSSTVSSRASHLSAQPSNGAAMARLFEKKKEFEAVAALERASALFLRRIEGLAEDCDIMAESGIVHGQVLAQWPQMFRVLDMFLAARETSSKGPNREDASSLSGERLVRVPLEDLQSTEGS
ncbi:hypothetical protein FA95DRAFT_1589816 [Auriscalpium vulgare]|uniref:Uncharacterized protein n=1 Tax=Auriscalpium vulgare TaxID=40419 RepID=A0ACB8RNT5_9AGAM|nr:hypothetical protein FA95DRAFT_1589816 [Auriscalpium vulgare]